MKKIFGIIALVCVIGAFAFVAPENANDSAYVKLYTGSAGDTLIASTTLSKIVNVNSTVVPKVAVEVFIDAISGTPKGTATLYQSLDGVNFVSTGQSVTWSTGVDSLFYLTSTAFYGTYAKVKITSIAGTQKAKVTATLKSYIQ